MTKSEQQQLIRNLWYKQPRSTVLCETGFGKTKVVTGYGSDIGILQALNSKHPEYTALIVVPGKDLKKAWIDEIEERGIKNTTVSTVQKLTRAKEYKHYDLLVVDEVIVPSYLIAGTS